MVSSNQLPLPDQCDMSEETDEAMVDYNMKRAANHNATIKVIGIGGGGINSIGKMIENPLNDVEYCIVDSNRYTLQSEKFQDNVTSIAIDPERYIVDGYDDAWFNRYYANDENEKMVSSIIDQSTKHIIIVAGFGGRIGTFGTKWLASLYKKMNVDVAVVCTIPFVFEQEKKVERALMAVKSLEATGITVKTISAEDLKEKHEDLNFFNCFSYLDEHVAEAVTEIYNSLQEHPGLS